CTAPACVGLALLFGCASHPITNTSFETGGSFASPANLARQPARGTQPEALAMQVAERAPAPATREQVRTDCIKGRRLICGKVLQVLPEGLVVESGYTNLMRHPLTQFWVAPRSVWATRNPYTVEANEPGGVCVGLVFLIDTPKFPPAHQYDYVIIQAYPAGQY